MSNLIAEMEGQKRFIRHGGEGYDDGRRAWQLAADLRPAAIAFPSGDEEVAAVVRHAAAHQLRVAPISTGHNARALGDLDNTVLLWTNRLTGVEVDAENRRARVRGGELWLPVVEQAAAYGLAALHGSSPDVGVAGYTLGGGLGWYGRKYGLAANAVTAIELVTADGALVRADAQHEPELFWALRGGGAGNFGVITALEFDLLPVDSAYAGALIWDIAEAPAVLARWAEWAATVPETVSTSYRHFQFPPIDAVPEPFRGRSLVLIDGAVLEDDAEAARLLAPLRELKPETDTFTRLPAPALARLHQDPEEPTAGVGRTAGLFDALPAAAIDRLLSVAGPDAKSPLLVPLEVRQLGGAVSRPHPGGGALDHVDGNFMIFNGTMAPTPEDAVRAFEDAGRLITAMALWANGRQYLNFVEEPIDTAAAFTASAWSDLRRIRSSADPAGLFQACHEIPLG